MANDKKEVNKKVEGKLFANKVSRPVTIDKDENTNFSKLSIEDINRIYNETEANIYKLEQTNQKFIKLTQKTKENLEKVIKSELEEKTNDLDQDFKNYKETFQTSILGILAVFFALFALISSSFQIFSRIDNLNQATVLFFFITSALLIFLGFTGILLKGKGQKIEIWIVIGIGIGFVVLGVFFGFNKWLASSSFSDQVIKNSVQDQLDKKINEFKLEQIKTENETLKAKDQNSNKNLKSDLTANP